MKQPFCTPAQALRRVLDAAAALPVPATERVPLDDACGRIAARDLCARMDQPPLTGALWMAMPSQCRHGRGGGEDPCHPAGGDEALRRGMPPPLPCLPGVPPAL